MAKIISSWNLRRYISRTGPYIYFYNDSSEFQNTENVKYINYIAKIHHKIKVFQIDWKEQLNFNPLSSPEEKHKIYLYYYGEKKFETHILAKENIDLIFIKCLEIFNKNMENLSKNVGSVGKRLPKDDNDLKFRFRKELSEKEVRYFENRKRQFLRQKIQSPIYVPAQNKKILPNPSTETALKNLGVKKIVRILETVKILIIRQ